jgi:hypothetical protein
MIEKSKTSQRGGGSLDIISKIEKMLICMLVLLEFD